MSRLVFVALVFTAFNAMGMACKKDTGAATPNDASASNDATGEPAAVACPPVDGGPSNGGGGGEAGTMLGTDEFGPNAPVAKSLSSLGRVNVYEVTVSTLLERLDIYLQADLPSTRLTIAIQEAPSRTAPFSKLADVQIDFGVCQGWASTGPLAIPLRVGRFYAMGFDPNQVVTPSVSTDAESLPIDGTFGRLIGSRTANSISVSALSWEKFMDKEYNRQRVMTSPRVPDSSDSLPVLDAGADGSSSDRANAAGDGGSSDAAGGAVDAGNDSRDASNG